MRHVNQHRAGGWRVRGAHRCCRWHGQELNQRQRVRISEQKRWLGGKLPAGWESQCRLTAASVMCSRNTRKVTRSICRDLPARTAASPERDLSQRFASQPGVTLPFLTSGTSGSLFPGTSSILATMCAGSRWLSGHQRPWSVARRCQVRTQINFSLHC